MTNPHRHCPGRPGSSRVNSPTVLTRCERRGCLPVGGLASRIAGRLGSCRHDPGQRSRHARLLVGAELLALDFYARPIASKRLGPDALGSMKRASLNEREHYNKVSEILSGAGQEPAVSADYDFSYPKGAFASKASIAKLGVTLEAAFMGAYLGTVDGLQTDALKQPVAQIAANEAEHLSVFMRLSGRSPIGISLPRPLSIDQASNALDVLTS